MGIYKKATNIYIKVRGTYTSISGTSYEEVEEVIIEATKGDLELISAKKVILDGGEGGVCYEKWKKIEREDIWGENPNISEIYYTDLQGNRIEESDFEPDMIICLNIKGVRLKEEKANINLDNAQVDFEYKDKYLENDILSNYIFEGDEQKIELKVIKLKNEKL